MCKIRGKESTTPEHSPTGQRYIHHREKGSRVLLFVREFKSDRITNSAAAYTYLGTAYYVKHEGEKPMNITWRLGSSDPGEVFEENESAGDGVRMKIGKHNKVTEKGVAA